MGLPAVASAYYPSSDELRDQMLSEVLWGYHKAGLVCNVAQGSELWYRYDAIAKRMAIALANNQLALRNVSPLTATGQQLIDLAAVFGVTARPASSAAGYVIVVVGGPVGTHVLIPAGFVCTSGGGIQYEATGAFLVANGETIEVQAVTAGSGTDLAAGELVTWDSAAIGFLGQTATVDSGGISGGDDADDEEKLRARLLSHLSMPAVGGNSANIKQWAEESSAAIDWACCYPAVRGPSSYDVAIMQNESTRTLSLATINACAAYLLSKMPGSEDLNVTTVFEQTVDVCIDARLPLPVNAGGSGGGWRDVSPWPTNADAANTYCEILAVTTATKTIRVNSTAADPPLAGRHIMIWNPAGGSDGLGAMVEFAVVTVTGVGPPHYDLVLDATVAAMSFITTGMLVSAAASNLTQYARAFRDKVALLGPGEKTASPDILPRARRTPSQDVEYPAELTNVLLTSVADGFPEIIDLSYAARYTAGTGESGTSTWVALTTPSVPATTAQPPRILVPGTISFRYRA